MCSTKFFFKKKRNNKLYCSKKCLGKFRSISNSKKYPCSKVYKNVCENCTKIFFYKYFKKTCSKRCLSERKSFLFKKAYKNPNRIQKGGNTKWFNISTSIGILKVQGSYDVRACKILDILKENKEIYNWEYTKDRIEYYDAKNIKRNYLIDFKIWVSKNNFYYLEIKGFEKENDKYKWKSVRDKGYKLEVWFNEELKEMENKFNR